MKMRRLAGVVAAAALLVGSMGTAAVAAPPPNDDVGMPTEVVTVPSSFFEDTTDATVGMTDPITSCVGPVGATVWFRYVATSDGLVQFNTFGSTNYDSVIAVYVEEAIEANEIACNDDAGGTLQSRVNVTVMSGTTYLIMVGSLGDGGLLQFNTEVGGPPIEITVSIDPRGTVVPKTGEAMIRGTVTCSEPTMLGVDGMLRQRLGRVFIEGGAYTELYCDGSAAFELPIVGWNGLFTGGKAEAQVYAFSFDDYDAYGYAMQNVRLSGVKSSKK
jgi:hypothetical protein